MKRALLIVLLGLGTIAGYGASCASMHLHNHQRHARLEDRVAEVCAAAAHRVYDQRSQPSPQAPNTLVVPWGYPNTSAPANMAPPPIPSVPPAVTTNPTP